VSKVQLEISPSNDSASVLRDLPEWFGIESAIASYCAVVRYDRLPFM
jgi:hypothetical protein